MSRSIRLGVFIVATLLILGAAVFIIGDKQLTFTPTYRVNTDFPDVSGLVEGAEVRIGGVRKGTVTDIRLPSRPDQKVTVQMDLESSTRNLIKQDSVASIQTEGLLGNKFLSVSFGTPAGAAIHDGDTLRSAPPLDFSDLLGKTTDLMAKTDVILGTTQVAMKNIEAATGQVKDITSKINRGQGTIGALVNDRTLYNEVNEVVAQSQVALQNVNAATAEAHEITAKINDGHGTIGALLNDRSLYDQINATAASARQTAGAAEQGVASFNDNMEALKHNWLFRGFFRNRGYFDAAELTRYEIPSLPAAQPVKTFVLDTRRIFDKRDNAKLEHEKELNPIGRYLEQNPFGLVVVAAYAGLAGDREENMVLTQARALAVRQYLAEKFRLDDSRIKTRGMGEAVQAGAADESRVEVLVYPEGYNKSVTQTSSAK